MTIEYDEKGKRFTDIVTMRTIHATIQTATHLLRGRIHVRMDKRIKDELDLDDKFLAVTDVNVLSSDGQILFEAPFLAVNRAHIIWVLPEQSRTEEASS